MGKRYDPLNCFLDTFYKRKRAVLNDNYFPSGRTTFCRRRRRRLAFHDRRVAGKQLKIFN